MINDINVTVKKCIKTLDLIKYHDKMNIIKIFNLFRIYEDKNVQRQSKREKKFNLLIIYKDVS